MTRIRVQLFDACFWQTLRWVPAGGHTNRRHLQYEYIPSTDSMPYRTDNVVFSSRPVQR